MNKLRENPLTDIALALTLLVLLLVAYNPLQLLMPDMILIILSGAIASVLVLFVVLVWKEQDYDERDTRNRLIAGKYSFIAGTVVLAVGNIVQLLQHEMNIWLPLALAVMVITKMVSLIRLERS
ncbi:MAG: hypothetical protein TR69_WS6001001361 [candidate division WS6 bacterium OLB20]|uniref:Uncharacterized protein n=1 Tax=candidate division WS6 bacterium OLB20 TaxID=1617426 RepID=A0A136LWS4_9BACT|nr:MAG: hypothetical protein TR69_WS6001001361 [candidate division WS6 bacterium OLB20]